MDWIKEDQEYIFQTYKRQPLVLAKAKGSFVWDVKGKKYLDFFAGLGVNNLGHAHPAVVKAATAQLKKVIHTCNLYYTTPQIECAKALVQRTFPGRVFFCNSGGEALECAIKMARKWGGRRGGERPEMISFYNSFHGRTMGALTLTGQEKYRQGFGPLLEKAQYARMNDLESVRRLVTDKTSAVFIEPIQGEGGVIPADREFLKSLRELCDSQDLLLVFDEVQCGLGRSGKLFAYQHFGVVPDVLTVAKGLGGGLPIGAVVAGEKAAGLLGQGEHATTFGGNPVVCAATLAVLKTLSPSLLKSVESKSKFLFSGLQGLKKKFPGKIQGVRGTGLMAGVVLKGSGDPLVDACRDKGLLINCTQGNVIRLLPPLTVSMAEIKSALKTLEEALKNFKS